MAEPIWRPPTLRRCRWWRTPSTWLSPPSCCITTPSWPDLEELSRFLCNDGAILAVTNGPADKAEIRQVWREAGRRVGGPTFEVPRWLDDFNLDNGPSVLGEFFDVVALDRTKGTFLFPGPGPSGRGSKAFVPASAAE